jgi:hypothetical protein
MPYSEMTDRMKNHLTQSPLISPVADRSDTVNGGLAQTYTSGHGLSLVSGM